MKPLVNDKLPVLYSGPGLPDEANCFPEIKHDIELVRDSILQILNTFIGERLFLPEFGCDLMKLVFEPNDILLQKLLEEVISQAISVWEPRVSVRGLVVSVDEHTVKVNLYLVLRRINTMFNLPLEISRDAARQIN